MAEITGRYSWEETEEKLGEETEYTYAAPEEGIEETNEEKLERLWKEVIRPALIGALAGTAVYGVYKAGITNRYNRQLKIEYQKGYDTARLEDNYYVSGMIDGVKAASGTDTIK